MEKEKLQEDNKAQNSKKEKLFESIFYSTIGAESNIPLRGDKDPNDKSDVEDFVNSLSL